MVDTKEFFQRLDEGLEAAITHQRRKVLEIARRITPSILQDDLFNPQDFPELQQSALFNYEDGILAGLLSSQMALRAEWRCSGQQPALNGPVGTPILDTEL
jgi:hypothetical protein